MIIECPNCNTKFEFESDAKLLGKKMKCSECAYMWVYLPEESEEPAPSLQAIISPNEVKIAPKVDVVEARRFATRDILKVASTICFLLFIMAGILLLDYLKTHDTSLRLANTNGLRISSVECKEESVDASNNSKDEVELWIKVDIANSANTTEKLEKMRISVYDRDDKFLDELVMDVDKEIAAKSNEIIEGRLNRIPSASMFIVIDLGNSAQIFLRDKSVLSKI